MVAVTIYVEGGGPGKAGKSKCRKGFRKFLERAGFVGSMPGILACGSRDNALKDFCVALKNVDSGELPLLLVDSEAPVLQKRTAWQHLQSRDGWQRPVGAQDEQVHLMVQCMESWFLADVSKLESFFGSGFRSTSLSKRDDIEKIPKDDVLSQLNSASRSSKRGSYRKGRHSFELLELIDPDKVIQHSRFAERLVDTLKAHLIPA